MPRPRPPVAMSVVAAARRARMPAARSLLVMPWPVLVPLAVVQWFFVLLTARRTVHNHWLFPQGGTATYFYAAAGSLAHGHVPAAQVGYGWPLLTSPIARAAGRIFVDGLPPLVLVQTLVLVPVALLAVYGIARRTAGPILGYVAAAGWVFIPYAVIPLFVASYRPTYKEQLLPPALGLTGLSDLASMVCVLAAAYFVVTSLDTRAPLPAALAGLLAGFAIGIDVWNSLFLAAPVVGYAIARRWRSGLAFGLALLPALVTLALWRYRGLGHFPGIHVHVDLDRLRTARLDFRSAFYSDRVVEVAFIAGVIAIARRSWSKSAFIAVWYAAFLVARLSAPEASIPSGTSFRLLMPAFPAFLIAACSVPLLVPRLGERLAAASGAPRRVSRLNWRDPRVVAACAVFGALPLAVVAVLPVQKAQTEAAFPADNVLVPIDSTLQPQAIPGPGAASLTWQVRTSKRATTFYTIYRSRPDAGGGVNCDGTRGAIRCVLSMQKIGSTTLLSWGDSSVPSGKWIYRVGLAANAQADTNAGGLLLLSAPVEVTIPP
jgi:hypothetical protein